VNPNDLDELAEKIKEKVDLNKVIPYTAQQMLGAMYAGFVRKGQPETQAKQNAEIAILEIANAFGGQIFYIPMMHSLRRALRDIDISKQFNDGKKTPTELAAEYGVSIQHIYTIAKRVNGKPSRKRGTKNQIKDKK